MEGSAFYLISTLVALFSSMEDIYHETLDFHCSAKLLGVGILWGLDRMTLKERREGSDGGWRRRTVEVIFMAVRPHLQLHQGIGNELGERSAFSLISTPVALPSCRESFHPIDPAVLILAQHEL